MWVARWHDPCCSSHLRTNRYSSASRPTPGVVFGKICRQSTTNNSSRTIVSTTSTPRRRPCVCLSLFVCCYILCWEVFYLCILFRHQQVEMVQEVRAEFLGNCSTNSCLSKQRWMIYSRIMIVFKVMILELQILYLPPTYDLNPVFDEGNLCRCMHLLVFIIL